MPVYSTLFIFSSSRMIVGNAQVKSSVSSKQRSSFLIVNSSIQQLNTGIIAALGGAFVANDHAKKVLNYPMLSIIGAVLGILALLVFKKIKTRD